MVTKPKPIHANQLDADNAAAFLGLTVGLAIITPVIVLLIVVWSMFL